MYEKIITEARNCQICKDYLPLGPKPIFRIHPEARVAIISQAPGRLAHRSGISWDDPSGERLRAWLEVDRRQFYETPFFAILPMGFCYPGKGKSGDLPPRRECAPQWHESMLALMPHIRLSLVIGQYAQRAYLGKSFKKNLTETVRAAPDYLPEFFPLPHPSPLNARWRKRNPWFETETLPLLRRQLAQW